MTNGNATSSNLLTTFWYCKGTASTIVTKSSLVTFPKDFVLSFYEKVSNFTLEAGSVVECTIT